MRMWSKCGPVVERNGPDRLGLPHRDYPDCSRGSLRGASTYGRSTPWKCVGVTSDGDISVASQETRHRLLEHDWSADFRFSS